MSFSLAFVSLVSIRYGPFDTWRLVFLTAARAWWKCSLIYSLCSRYNGVIYRHLETKEKGKIKDSLERIRPDNCVRFDLMDIFTDRRMCMEMKTNNICTQLFRFLFLFNSCHFIVSCASYFILFFFPVSLCRSVRSS